MEVTHEFVDKDYFHIRYVGGDFCNYCKNCCVDHQSVICSCLGVCSYRNSSANISCNALNNSWQDAYGNWGCSGCESGDG